MLIVIIIYLVSKMYTREGLKIEYIESPKGFVPFVPVDSLCMVLAAMGLPVNKFGSAFAKCGFDKTGVTQPDNSDDYNEQCPA
jgi:hypothetical protein